MPSDLSYIDSVLPRIKYFSGVNSTILGDLSFIIETKGILSGCFGYGNCTYADAPTNGTDYGYIEFFKHADNYVTVKLYQENTQNIYIRRFILGNTTWYNKWHRTELVEVT